MVRVRLMGLDGKLGSPVEVKKLELTDAEWQKRLTPKQYKIGRNKGTEPAFCGGLLNNKGEGVYVCAGCGLPLFSSSAKFESGTGWPSFFQPVATENIVQKPDLSHGMNRIEILCARCDMHLGHVFDDGPKPTGKRFCMNSDILRFVPEDQLWTLAEGPAAATTAPSTEQAAAPAGANAPSTRQASTPHRAEAVFAGGCFWCVEAVFEEIDGVQDVISGYAGGDADTANYDAVSTGLTGHAEAIKIIYDPTKVSYEQLLKVHFATHDPTSLNRQGNDVGPQYRSAIFYANDRQYQLAKAFIQDLTDAKVYSRPIVTTLEPLKAFYPAEMNHQNFVCNNPHNPYVQAVAMPKVEKVRTKFKNLVKKVSPIPQ